MNQLILDNFFDKSFEERMLAKRGELYRITKNKISIPADVYENVIRPLQKRFGGTYLSSQGSDKQVYTFSEKGKAQGFLQELFLKTTPAEQLNNTRIPFSDLVVRKDDYNQDLYHILKDTPDSDGKYPVIAYFDSKDLTLRTPVISEHQEMNSIGNWKDQDNGTVFYFETAHDLVNFSQSEGVQQFYGNIVVKRYDESLDKELSKFESTLIQSHQQQTTAPNIQPRSDTSSDDNGNNSRVVTSNVTTPATSTRNKEKHQSGDQLSLFTEAGEGETEADVTANNSDYGTKQHTGTARPNDEGRNQSEQSDDNNIHESRTNQPNVSDDHDRPGRRTDIGDSENNEGLPSQTEEQPSGTTLHSYRSEQVGNGKGGSEGADAVDYRPGDSTRMGNDDKEHGDGSQSGEGTQGNEPSVSSRPGRTLSDNDVQPLSEGPRPRPSENPGNGNDNVGVQTVLKKKEEEIRNQNSWFASEHPIEIPKAGTAEAIDTNIKALEVLASVLEDKRLATPEEQDTLAKYTGFGNTKIPFFSDDSYFIDRLGEKDKERYDAVKDACDRIEKATMTMPSEYLNRIGLTEPIKSSTMRSNLQKTMLTAFYTDDAIVRPMWSFAEQMGFKGGKILDPSVGNARFESNMPKAIARKSSLTLIDKDSLSSMISAQLHPGAKTINTAYEDYSKHNKSDFIITNAPFSDINVTDPEWVKEGRLQQPEYKASASQLTSYFPVKSLENLNAGGLLAFITTSNFLDAKHNEGTRRLLANQAEFIGAIRLPMNTFANADVQSDILLFRKFNQGERKEQHQQFLSSEEKLNPFFEGWNRYYELAEEFVESGASIKDFPYYNDIKKNEGTIYTVNEYFEEHPENIIGEVEKTYLNNRYRPAYNSQLTPEQIGGEVQNRINTIVSEWKQAHENKQVNIESVETAGSQINNQTISPTLQKKIDAYNKVRESLNSLLKAYETNDSSQVVLRASLNNNYNLFVKDYGHILDKKNVVDLGDQPEFAKVGAIEKWQQVSTRSMKYIGKADLFTTNTIHPVAQDITSDVPQDIINHSLHKFNRIDTGLLQEKIGDDWKEKTKGLIYLNPATKEYEPANYYLGGDVKTKLEEAKHAAEDDPSLQENVTALEQVQPKNIPITDISINFGANFVPAEIYTAYIKEQVFHNRNLSDDSFHLTYNGSSLGSSYGIHINGFLNVDKTLCFGSKRASDILENALNDNHVIIYYPREDKEEKPVQDEKTTFAANSKIDEIRDGFISWLSQPKNAHYAKFIEETYNEKYNRIAPIKYDANFVEPVGSTLRLRPHQKSAVARILTGNDTLIDHPVGYGKTAVMIAGIQEQHRLGLARKTLLLCMKANVKQVAQEYQKMYPNANILFPTEKDFSAKNRNILLNKIKTNKYDCVILTHDQYGRLEHSKEIQEELIRQKLDEYTSAIDANPDKNAPNIKQLVRKQEKLEEQLKSISAKPHDPLAFEELGFDKLYVDESHQFKNLTFITTHNKVAGLGSPEGSQKATKLLLGVRHIQKVNGGDRGVVFATGTPITNSIVEAYSIMQFLRPTMLKDHNHQSFDAWAAQYAKKSEELEVQPSMAIKRVDRFREFINIPEVQKDYLSFADVPDAANVKFDKPRENKISVTVPSGGETHMNVLKALKQVTENGESDYLDIHLSDDKKSARSLVATTAGAKEAISSRFLGIEPADLQSDKATAIAREIASRYRKTDEHKGVQLVFSEIVGKGKAELYDDTEDGENQKKCDAISNWKLANYKEKFTKEDREQCLKDLAESGLEINSSFISKHWTDDEETELDENARLDVISNLATGGSGDDEREYNLFADIKGKLVNEYSIPESEIVSIRDYSPAKRKEFFDLANKGEVRVLMGSTQTLGTGVNVQSHVVAMHHADVPWTPASVEQRTGRGVRQGNEVAKLYGNQVDNIFYLKEKSADSKKYNLLDIKQNFINGFRNGSSQERTMDTKEQSAESFFKDCLDETLGNPLYSELHKLKGKYEILKKERAAFNAQTLNLSSDLTHYTSLVEAHRASEVNWKDEADYLTKNSPAKVDGKFPVEMTVNGTKYTTPKEAGDAIFRSTATSNKTIVEAYGYKFNITNSLDAGHPNDRIVSILSRTGDDSQNKLPFNDLQSTATGKFSLSNADKQDASSVSKPNNVHIALCIRSIADDILNKGKSYQEKKVLCNEQVKNLTADLETRKLFPKADELQKIENRIHEIDLQLNGQTSLDLRNWKQLSDTWNGKEGNSEKLTIPASGSVLDIKEQLFTKYLEMAHDEGTVRNSLDMQRYQFKDYQYNGNPVQLAGPLTIADERIRAILPQDYLKGTASSKQELDIAVLKDFFIRQAVETIVLPQKERGQDPRISFVESPDFTMCDKASDPALKENHLNRYVEANNPVLIISGTDTQKNILGFKDIKVDFFQVKSSFPEYVTNSFLNELHNENFNLNPADLFSKYENQASVARSLENTLCSSGWNKCFESNSFPDNVTYTVLQTNGSRFDSFPVEEVSKAGGLLDFSVKIEDLRTLYEGGKSTKTSPTAGDCAPIKSLGESYRTFANNPQNADINYDSIGANKFIQNFTVLSTVIEQERRIASAYGTQTPQEAAGITAHKLFGLLSSNIKELAVNHPAADGNVHLLASNTDHRIMPDPYYYANSAETFSGDNVKITIPEEVAKNCPSADEVSVWKCPATSQHSGGNLDSDFYQMCHRAGIVPKSEMMRPDEKTQRITNTSFSNNFLLGTAKFITNYYSKRDTSNLFITFDNNMSKASDFNKQMPVTSVGVYQTKNDTYKQHLLVYPLAAKVSNDKDGNELKLVATALFSTNKEQEGRTEIFNPNILQETQKNGVRLDGAEVAIAGNLLDEADKSNLVKLGTNDRTISIQSPAGHKYNLLLCAKSLPASPDCYEIKAYDPSSLKINEEKKKAFGLTDEHIELIKSGKSVECRVNGQDAHLLLNPNDGTVAALSEKPAFADRYPHEQQLSLSASEEPALYRDYSSADVNSSKPSNKHTL